MYDRRRTHGGSQKDKNISTKEKCEWTSTFLIQLVIYHRNVRVYQMTSYITSYGTSGFPLIFQIMFQENTRLSRTFCIIRVLSVTGKLVNWFPDFPGEFRNPEQTQSL